MSTEEKYERLSRLLQLISGNVQPEKGGFDPEVALIYISEQTLLKREERAALALLRAYVEICDALRDAPYPSPDYRARLERALDLSRELFAATRKLL